MIRRTLGLYPEKLCSFAYRSCGAVFVFSGASLVVTMWNSNGSGFHFFDANRICSCIPRSKFVSRTARKNRFRLHDIM